ncbi:hypothetical protein BGW38_006126, partial [Lunasporangiospora selenospora]
MTTTTTTILNPIRAIATKRTTSRSSTKKTETQSKKAAIYTTEPLERTRSFLLDKPSKPKSKRLKASTNLPKSASDFERRMASNPYALLTKLIEVDSSSSGPRSWIVPDGIIPRPLLSAQGQAEDRFALGRWVATDSSIIDATVKEGRYKIISTSAYVRPDLSKLIYAQWAIKAGYEIEQLTNTGRLAKTWLRPLSQVSAFDSTLQKPLSFSCLDSLDKPLQCVLYFKSGMDSSNPTKDPAKESIETDPESAPKPSLPTFTTRSAIFGDFLLQTTKEEGNQIFATSVPVYDIEQMFGHDPSILDRIRECCQGISSADHTPLQFVGLVEAKATVDFGVDLWRMMNLFPRQRQLIEENRRRSLVVENKRRQ